MEEKVGMKRKVALLMITVMLAIFIFPAGITAHAEGVASPETAAAPRIVTPVTSHDKVKYTSSNKKVATVSKKGWITAKGKGKATITVKSGNKTVKVKIAVK